MHTNTGCEYEDHSRFALWAGPPVPLDLEIFTPKTQTDDFDHTRGDAGNPVCAAAKDTCGTAAQGGPLIVCCDDLACSCGKADVCICS